MLCRWAGTSKRVKVFKCLRLRGFCRQLLGQRHSVMSQETWIFSSTAVRTPNLANFHCYHLIVLALLQ